MSQTREAREAAARARMAELAAKFVARTMGEMEAMRAQLVKLSAGEPQALAEIRNLAHRTSGTGATLGFEVLADCALRVEQLAEAQAPDVAPAPEALVQIGKAIDALDAELARIKEK